MNDKDIDGKTGFSGGLKIEGTKAVHERLSPLKLDKCQKTNCEKLSMKRGMCKSHFCQAIRMYLSKEFRNLYRSTEDAYGSMDFRGQGYITQEDFMKCMVVQGMSKKGFTKDDILLFLQCYNVFPLKGGNRQKQTDSGHAPQRGVMIFDSFKKTFFPHYHQTYQTNEAKKEDNADDIKLTNRILKQPTYIKEKLIKLDQYLKEKFAQQWTSVRKSFLDLDLDHDGFITSEDIVRYFGADNEFNFQEVKKLLSYKVQNINSGRLNYGDFSRWVGNAIHSVQGFYFRHDSVLNPVFERNAQRYENKVGQFRSRSKTKGEQLNDKDQALKQVLEKIQFQWKTIKKSFHDFSKEKSGGIEPDELRFYLNHWGLQVNEDVFNYIYQELDWDKDGLISYADFQKTVGCEIHPGEGLYFRQDQPLMLKINTCKHPKCWQATKQGKNFCNLHQKTNTELCVKKLIQIYTQIGKKWRRFLTEVKKHSVEGDVNQIGVDVLTQILNRYQYVLKEEDREMLLDVFPGEDEGQRTLLNINYLYSLRQQHEISKQFKQTQLDESDQDDNPVDLSGYTGALIRPKENLDPINEQDFYKILSSNELKFVQVLRTIRTIDKDNNGFVTITELDDILKIVYPEFKGRDLLHHIKFYRSIQNRILVDYKRFRNRVASLINKPNSKSPLKLESSPQSSQLLTSEIELNRLNHSLDIDPRFKYEGSLNISVEKSKTNLNQSEVKLKPFQSGFKINFKNDASRFRRDLSIQDESQNISTRQGVQQSISPLKSDNMSPFMKLISQNGNTLSSRNNEFQVKEQFRTVVGVNNATKLDYQIQPPGLDVSIINLLKTNSSIKANNKTAFQSRKRTLADTNQTYGTNNEYSESDNIVKQLMLEKRLKSVDGQARQKYLNRRHIINKTITNFNTDLQGNQDRSKSSIGFFNQRQNAQGPMSKRKLKIRQNSLQMQDPYLQSTQIVKGGLKDEPMQLGQRAMNQSSMTRYGDQWKQGYESAASQQPLHYYDTQSNSDLQSVLAERIKEFRKEIQDKQKIVSNNRTQTQMERHRPNQQTRVNRQETQDPISYNFEEDESVKKFRSTMQSFGFNISKQRQQSVRRDKSQSNTRISREDQLKARQHSQIREQQRGDNRSQQRAWSNERNQTKQLLGFDSRQSIQFQHTQPSSDISFCKFHNRMDNCSVQSRIRDGLTASSISNGHQQFKFTINKTDQVQSLDKSKKKGSKPQEYTVYLIEVQTCISSWSLSYRYSELKTFHEYVKKHYADNFFLPKFPSKRFWKNEQKVIHERRIQLMGNQDTNQSIIDYLNTLTQRINILSNDFICSFLKIEGYLRDYLNDLNGGNSIISSKIPPNFPGSPKGQSSPRGKRKLTNLDNYMNDDYDLDYSNVMETGASNRAKLPENMPQLLRTQSSQQDLDDYSKPLLEITREMKLTDEEIITRFFNCIASRPVCKDFYIRDFEEFYFKVRPRFGAKLIKQILEGDQQYDMKGLLNLLGEVEHSLVSACSTLQLVSKLLDYQKNVYADTFIRELAKIDPQQMKRYNFERFLEKENSEGYRQCALNILQAYVDQRIALKTKIGTLQMAAGADTHKRPTSQRLLSDQQQTSRTIQIQSTSNIGTSGRHEEFVSKKNNSSFIIPRKSQNLTLNPQLFDSSQDLSFNITNQVDKSQSHGQIDLKKVDSTLSTPKNGTSELSKIMLSKLEKINFQDAIEELVQITYNSQNLPMILRPAQFHQLLQTHRGKDIVFQLESCLDLSYVSFTKTILSNFLVQSSLFSTLRQNGLNVRASRYVDHNAQILEMVGVPNGTVRTSMRDATKVQMFNYLNLRQKKHVDPITKEVGDDKFLFYIFSDFTMANPELIENIKQSDQEKHTGELTQIPLSTEGATNINGLSEDINLENALGKNSLEIFSNAGEENEIEKLKMKFVEKVVAVFLDMQEKDKEASLQRVTTECQLYQGFIQEEEKYNVQTDNRISKEAPKFEMIKF